MGRNHSKAVTSRKNPGAKKVNKVILYCEGRNTEPSYFELLKKSNCTVVPMIIRGQGNGSCQEFVEEANKKYNCLPRAQRDKYSQKWLVYDYDGHEDFATSVKYARECGFRVAFSNMCIEYWFALHFYDLDGKPIPIKANSHSQAQIDLLNEAVELYNKKAPVKVKLYDYDSKIVEDDFFELMMAIDPVSKKSRILSAFERAKAIHETKKAQGAEFMESVTTIYELLLELGVIEKNNDGYALYMK